MQKVERHVERDAWEGEEEIDLMQYFEVLKASKWFILLITLFIGGLAAGYAKLSTPIYQADALLQVEEKSSGLGGTGDLMSLLGEGGGSAETEIEIIRSRSVLGQVIEKLRLDIVAKPKSFPVFGAYLQRTYAEEGFREPVFELNDYAWGGELIQVDRLELPDSLLGEALYLQKGNDRAYQLYIDDVLLLSGNIGEFATSSDGLIKIFVSQLVAREGVRFAVSKLRFGDVMASCLKSLSVQEKGKGTGIISLSFTSTSRELAKNIVDAISNIYLRQNVERKSEEAKRSLVFLQKQLPKVRSQLEAAEVQKNEFRLKSGSVNLTIETQAVLSQLVEMEQQLSELDMKKSDLAQRFTAKHPLMQVLEEKRARILEDKKGLQVKVKQLPETEQKMLTLMRNVQVNAELYTFLLNKSQELKVVEAGTVGNVRILDYAMLPYKAIKPKKTMIAALGIVLGLFFGIVIVFVRKAMNQGVEDADLVEKKTGLAAFAGIPHSLLQEKLHVKMRKHKGKEESALLALVDNADLAVESLRSLRTNLHFALLEAPNNIVMMTGPAPSLGKSFVSANFGAVLASSGKKVLLIDADMRKGHLHEYFGQNRGPGLSGLISGDASLVDAIHSTPVANLSIMPTGVLPPNPADLLMHERFDEVLNEVSSSYDLVLIDTPPVLAVTDAVLVGKRAGISFMLLRSGKHPMREIEQAVKHIDQAGVALAGFIFNDIMPRASGYGYGYGGYHYQYAYKKDDKS
ncbi:MAG: polysaccharide biosynthesis tyrosine autokinase [Mariprofundaceae bacterium]|nr:polysaccharide biosynthesis tyrosine autokinase [Mariprofundaceae bacterium]